MIEYIFHPIVVKYCQNGINEYCRDSTYYLLLLSFEGSLKVFGLMLKPVLCIISHVSEVLDGVRWTKEIAIEQDVLRILGCSSART